MNLACATQPCSLGSNTGKRERGNVYLNKRPMLCLLTTL